MAVERPCKLLRLHAVHPLTLEIKCVCLQSDYLLSRVKYITARMLFQRQLVPINVRYADVSLRNAISGQSSALTAVTSNASCGCHP